MDIQTNQKTRACTTGIVLALAFLTACSQPKEDLKSLALASYASKPDIVSIRIKNYRPRAGKTLQNLFVSNFSVVARHGTLDYSTARDGLGDSLKLSLRSSYGFNIASPESVVTGFSDFMLFQAGITVDQQPLMFCAQNLMSAAANDALIYNDDRAGGDVTYIGMRDCQKIYMGLDPNTFDSNKDGIPDYLNLRCGMNPLNKAMAFLSTAGDGMSNIDKCKRHIPIDEDYRTDANQVFAYTYKTDTKVDGTSEFTIGNIPVLNGGIDNFIAIYITETDNSTKTESLYSAFMILKKDYVGQEIQVNYWASDSPSSQLNQKLVLP